MLINKDNFLYMHEFQEEIFLFRCLTNISDAVFNIFLAKLDFQ
jgi:hypothetical protein